MPQHRASARAAPLFCRDVLQDHLVKAQVGDQLLQPCVLLLQLLELTGLIGLQACILLLPAVEGLLADADLADELRHRHPELGLLEHRHDLLDRKTATSHDTSSSPPRRLSVPKN